MNARSRRLRNLLAALVLALVGVAPAAEAGAGPGSAQAAAGAVPAQAAVEVEPNDAADDTARQPALIDGARVTGSLSSQDDYDSFRIMVGAGRSARVELTLTNTSPDVTGAVIGGAIGDRMGEEDIETSGDAGLGPGESAVVSATLNAAGAYRFTIQFPCESDDATDCPASVPGATWSLAVKVRGGALLLDADGVLGAAADAAAEDALDALIDAPDDDHHGGGKSTTGGSGQATCGVQSRSVQRATRKVGAARRSHRKVHTKATRRALRMARAKLGRATARLAECKAAAERAANAAEAAKAERNDDESTT